MRCLSACFPLSSEDRHSIQEMAKLFQRIKWKRKKMGLKKLNTDTHTQEKKCKINLYVRKY